MEARGWQDFLKKWPEGFAFFTFTSGVFGISFILKNIQVVDLFPFYQTYGWLLVPGLFGIVAVDRAFAKQRATRDSDECIDEGVFVVKTSRRLFEELYVSDDSVVKGAKKFLYVTGSRSRDKPYLDAIESQVRLRRNLAHVRLLVGEPRHQKLKDHVERLHSMSDASGLIPTFGTLGFERR
jgi:hypothetical protein